MDIKQKQITKLKQQIINNNLTSDLRKTATQLVIGSGSLNAKILFVGEAPGKKEDEQGLPFVGSSGKFLNVLLQSVNLNRDDIYITNIVKYRPPNNRDPSTLEKQIFWPYLLQQIKIINPQLIVTLGRHSLSSFLPKAKIGEVHGKLQKTQISGHNLLILPLYHPASALYNGSLRGVLQEDFKILSQFAP